jgi:2Fe-2S ferredoxin
MPVKPNRNVVRMPNIHFRNNDRKIEVDEGTSILEAALDHDVDIDNDCGANGVCGTCQVHIEEGHENLSAMTDEERQLLEMTDSIPNKSRLACQARIFGNIALTIPE